MAERKFDIFEVIKNIEGLQLEFFDGLADYEVKQIAPYVIMKWMSGVKDAEQLIKINDNMNRYVFAFYKHPKLCYKLLMASATRKQRRVSWIKRPAKDKTSLSLTVISDYYECSYSHAKDYLKLLSPQEVMEIGEMLGLDKETSAKLKKELNGK